MIAVGERDDTFIGTRQRLVGVERQDVRSLEKRLRKGHECRPVRRAALRGDARLARALSGFAGPKGNLRFPHDEPLPLGLIARIVRLKVKQDGAKAAAKKKRKSSH